MTLLTSGWTARPVSSRVRLRRSTVALLALFIGLGAILLQTRIERRSPTTVVVTSVVDEVPATSDP